MTQATGTSKATKSPEAIDLHWDPDSIPPFPAIALKALNLMSGRDTSLLDLCNLIRSDSAVSIAVLRIANSPLVAFSKNITSVLQASMLLGFERLRSIVITVGLKSYLKDSFTPLMTSCWRHSVACAIIAGRGAKSSFRDHDFAYTAGILHNIGTVALATLMPRSYASVVERGADRAEDLLRVESLLCGINHCEAGRSLMTAWNLPEVFLEIIACHDDSQGSLPRAASLIAPSCDLANGLGFAVVRYRSSRNYAEILNDFPEPVRKSFPADARELAREIGHEINVIESV